MESFEFFLDGNGQSIATTKPTFTGGVSVDCTAWIEEPDATFNIVVTSTAGTKVVFSNVKANQELNFKLKTNWNKRTTATVVCTADVANIRGLGKIKYRL